MSSVRRRSTTLSNKQNKAMFVPTFLDKFLPRKMGNVYILSSKNRIVLGPHWPGVLVTLALIAGGTNLNLQVIDTKYPIASATNASMKVLVFFFCTTTLLLFLKTACTEAGIITGVSPTSHQQLHDTESHDDGSITPHLSTHTSHSTHSLVTSPSPSTPLGLLVFCDICETYSLDSQNARHCPDCNVCLEQMDHHCPWTGQCIAKRNMPWFIAFNISWMVFMTELLLLVFVY